jgi:hypothetical protein
MVVRCEIPKKILNHGEKKRKNFEEMGKIGREKQLILSNKSVKN